MRDSATSDGAAIASAVAEHLVGVGSRTLFSTHYHRLADDREGDTSRVALGHMGCEVAGEAGTETVTFLYTLAAGSCPKSYGMNVARLAGLPESIISAAAERSAALEHGGAAGVGGLVRAAFAAAAEEEEAAGDGKRLRGAWDNARRALRL